MQRLLLVRIIMQGPVADFQYRLQDFAELDAGFVPAHQCSLGSIVNADAFHPGQTGNILFVEPDAGSAGNSFQDQAGLTCISIRGMDELALDLGHSVDFGLAQKIRHQVLPAR